MVFFEGGRGAVEVKHCRIDCGKVMAVHEHSSYQEVKDCLASMRPCVMSAGRGQGARYPNTRRSGTRLKH